ncbi:AAA domain-containing protein [Thelonectria olida]|uniref:AAA domain-containing protein n=1 Tax=Thelonectria olida TaxID=1576542 RepID=A0A9P9AMW2_9HYPO|nr:AAA domain-containing protein [Thelonectria olida]
MFASDALLIFYSFVYGVCVCILFRLLMRPDVDGHAASSFSSSQPDEPLHWRWRWRPFWLVFIDCLHTPVTTVDTFRLNQGQAKIALALIESLIKAHATKFVVVSPYKATKTYLEGLIQQRLVTLTNSNGPLYEGLRGVEAGTADSFQGKEEAVSIFLTTATQESGRGFVRDPRRFNLGVTRHIGFAFVIGDITTVGAKDLKEIIAESEHGGLYWQAAERYRMPTSGSARSVGS